METNVKLKLVIAQDSTPAVRDLTTFTLFENVVAKYEFDQIDFSEVGADAGNGFGQDEIDRRNRNMKWRNLTSQWGFDRATQEHAVMTRDRLKDAIGKVKWHLLAA